MKFYSDLTKSITPYKAGEQPKDKRYIKLNTNENPYPPSPAVFDVVTKACVEDLRLYPDPDTTILKEVISQVKNVNVENIFTGNGSDEVLSMIFAAFFNKNDKVAYADITYSFYEVYAAYYGLESVIIPLKDYKLIPQDYHGLNCKGIIIANPNAPTGDVVSSQDIESIVLSNKDSLVVVDQAYAAFSDTDITYLINKYDNLIVVETLSKSHALAGLRCGYCLANRNLILALERIKNCINSYTVNRLTIKMAAAALMDREYYARITEKIKATRERTQKALDEMGIPYIKSHSNFIFINLGNRAKEIYLKLKEQGILVRHFDKKGVNSFIRVTVGRDDEMDSFLFQLSRLISS
ncbi:MAG: histidinol-phosphate transaminase [Christensenellales bacterium]|jgi:histidinol-phosphate aminotransferase